MARRFLAPNARSPIVTKDGVLTPEWQRYLVGVDELSTRVGEPVADLSGGASLADVITKVNELQAALRAAGLLDEA